MLPQCRMFAVEASDIRRESEYHEALTGEALSEREMAEMAAGISSGPSHTSVSNEITFSNYAYGMVISDNEELDRKYHNCPRFGDIVAFKSLRGVDSPLIEVAARCMGDTSKFVVSSADGTRMFEVERDRKPVLLSIHDIELLEFTREELESKLTNAS